MVLRHRLHGGPVGRADRDDEAVLLVGQESEQVLAIASGVVRLERLHGDAELVVGPGDGEEGGVVVALVAQPSDVVDQRDLVRAGPGGPPGPVVTSAARGREEGHGEERDQRTGTSTQHRANRSRAPRQCGPCMAKVPSTHRSPWRHE
jgi:hypothetical protein